MSDELIATLIGLVAGAAGFMLATFWFQPILHFRRIRSQIMSDLVFYANAINTTDMNDTMKERMWKRVEANRRHSADLAANYVELPKLYIRYLSWRGIFPDRAVSDLMGLSSTFEWEAASKRVDNIQQHLNIEPRVT